MRYRKRLKPEEAKFLGIPLKEKKDPTRNPAYDLSKSQWLKLKEKRNSGVFTDSETLPNDYEKEKEFIMSAWDGKSGKILNIEEYCNKYNLNYEDVTSYKFLPYHYSKPTYHIVFRENKVYDSIKDIDFESIVKKHVKPVRLNPLTRGNSEFLFDRAVITDVHTGMEPNKSGHSLYGGKWDRDELLNRGQLAIDHILRNAKSNFLIYDDLGDSMDGQDGMTVRKGHSLPQNMDNYQAFDTAIDFRMQQVDQLAPKYEKIVFNMACNDNHSGAYGYYVNKMFKRLAEMKYDNVIVNLHRKFLFHYVFGNKCFICTHGKDGENLKFGFKPFLDSKQIEKIDDYITEHRLWDYDIEFSKGDSHQKIFDESTAQNFYYYNYGAFSPSSEWVQTNFKKGRSFFEFFNFPEKGEKKHHPYVFDWNTNRPEVTIDFSTI